MPDQESGSGRRFSVFTVLGFIPVFLIFIVSVVPLMIAGAVAGAILGLGGDTATMLAFFGWLLSGFLLLIKPVEAPVGGLVFKMRIPTASELADLQPAFERVCAAAGANPARYLVRVQDSREVNAAATGGHLVGVTRAALALPSPQLEALLAHEMGHHRDLSSASTALGWWWGLPSVAGLYVWWILMNITRFAGRVTTFFGELIPAVGWVIGIVALLVILFVLLLMGLPLLIAYRLTQLFVRGMTRPLEYSADRHAVDMGYGYALRNVFEGWMSDGHDDPEWRGSGLQRMWNYHPPLAKRIKAIDRHLAVGG